MVLGKTLESPLVCKEIKPVNRSSENGTQTDEIVKVEKACDEVGAIGLPYSGKGQREVFGGQRRLLSISRKNQKTGKSTGKEDAKRQDFH